jgi:hypothetical protein
MKEAQDFMSFRLYGMTKDKALLGGVCISCKKNIENEYLHWEEIDRKEYKISGLCPKCFDEITKEN